MIHQTLEEIETRLQHDRTLGPAQRAELLRLTATLRAEIAGLAPTHAEAARSIAGFAGLSAHEATRGSKDPRLLQLSVQGLAASVTGFEQSHPQLVEIVNRLCVTLSSLGI